MYKIFVSSCKRLLEEERRILAEAILMNEHIPVQMEFNFLGANTEYSIDIDMKKLKEADCVIFILSYLYGEIIRKKIGDETKCPLKEIKLKDCKSCDSEGCVLSFTHFEYEYAKLLGKPIVVIFNKHFNNENKFLKANDLYQKQYNGEDCKASFYEHKRKYNAFVSSITQKHAFPYSSHEDFIDVCSSAVKSAENLISVRQDVNGLVPYACLSELQRKMDEIKTHMNQMQISGINEIFDSQTLALKALEKEKDIYLGWNGEVNPIRILAIRGSSFTGGMGHEWTRFVLDEEFKEGKTIDIEFVLSDYKNETLIAERYTAFQAMQASAVALQKYKKDYVSDMKRVQAKINDYRKNHPCKLFLHNEAKLPFRMVFIGKYLYLSTFLNSVKAAEAPVLKISSTSTLYKVCEEYYKWIKSNSIEQT
ncbi:DUF4062 domain-containing protein [Blautia schinkii]|nr:DUF4062 domain-containing protein [Blautia schinkii]